MVVNGVGSVGYHWTGDTFFDNTDFVGAVKEGADWTAGWTVGL